jgi:hypothetical protein
MAEHQKEKVTEVQKFKGKNRIIFRLYYGVKTVHECIKRRDSCNIHTTIQGDDFFLLFLTRMLFMQILEMENK